MIMNMNKNLIGIFKYLTVILMSVFLPILLLIFCLNFKIYNYYPTLRQYDDILLTVIGFILILFTLIYFTVPIIITIIAIKYHWSTYLDKFFNSFIVPTILFFLAIVITVIYKHLAYFSGQGNAFLLDIYYAIVPPYCLIYLVILIHNIRRKYFHK